MFRHSFSGRHTGEWGFVVKNAKLEAEMLVNDYTIVDMANRLQVSVPCMKSYMKDEVQNKAYRQLCKLYPRLVE